MNESEQLLSEFSKMFFFEEFIQDQLQFIPDISTEIELADLLINLGDYVIAVQLKSRNHTDQTTDNSIEGKWLKEVCKKAKKQVTKTLQLISEENLPKFKNGKDIPIPIQSNAKIIPLVIFVNESIKEYNHLLEKHTENGINVNCLSFDDFKCMCETLVSPIEIIHYLEYRNMFYTQYKKPEFLITEGKEGALLYSRPLYKEGLIYQFLEDCYGITTASNQESYLFDFQDFIHRFPKHIVADSESSVILLNFFSHLNRMEIMYFIQNLHKTLNTCKTNPYKITGTLRNNEYLIIFISSEKRYFIPYSLLKKYNVNFILQINIYRENLFSNRINFQINIANKIQN